MMSKKDQLRLTPKQKKEKEILESIAYSRFKRKEQNANVQLEQDRQHYAEKLEQEFNKYIDGITRYPNKKQQLFEHIELNWKASVQKANAFNKKLQLNVFAFREWVRHYEKCMKVRELEPKLTILYLANMQGEELDNLIKSEAARKELLDKIIKEQDGKNEQGS